MMDYLPDDITTKVLLRLPIRTVFRCRSVCKTWCSLIDHLNFRHMHLGLIMASQPRCDGVVCVPDIDAIDKSFKFFTIPEVETDSEEDESSEEDDEDFLLVDEDCSLVDMFLPEFFTVSEEETDSEEDESCSEQDEDCSLVDMVLPKGVASVNGFVCLKLDKEHYVISNPAKEGDFIQLRDPYDESDRKFKSTKEAFGQWTDYDGFGWSRKTNEYKVINLHRFYRMGKDVESKSLDVQIQTIGSNNWRYLGTIPDYLSTFCSIGSEENGVFSSGHIHWCCADNKNIMTFNVEDERFKLFSLPSHIFSSKRHHTSYLKLGVLRGCLLIADYCHRPILDHQIRVWVMKDYGVDDSWTLEFNISMPEYSHLNVLGEFNNGNLLLSCRLACRSANCNQLLSYDPSAKTHETLLLNGLSAKWYTIHSHVATLATLKHVTGMELL